MQVAAICRSEAWRLKKNPGNEGTCEDSSENRESRRRETRKVALFLTLPSGPRTRGDATPNFEGVVGAQSEEKCCCFHKPGVRWA